MIKKWEILKSKEKKKSSYKEIVFRWKQKEIQKMNPKKRNRHWKEKKSSLENTILEEKTKRKISKTILEEEIIFRKEDI